MSRKNYLEKEVSKVTRQIEELKNRKVMLNNKIEEENILERLLVSNTTMTISNSMVEHESDGLIRMGYGVSDVPQNQKMMLRFLRKGSKTICTIYDDKKEVIGIGIAECHYEDDYDIGKGIAISEFRAYQDMFKRKEVAYY